MWWKWSDRREPRPNVKVHPLDVHALPKRLRGDDVEPEPSIDVWALALGAVIAWTVAGLIVVFA